ncbi:hypothetical protein [Hyphomicrobium sp.]|uniref:hypothetical protein n=1 Tax=Hyphomicrobium sp. TaxID=82 RepID=UPI000FBE441D|nr:hypothetical protein [Hyphomicrobium sp.]RUO98553.1 MAG: hypothetical protein EKK30_10000 [Hyphomicrobium sp.]
MGIYAVYAAAGIGIVVLMVSGPQPTAKALLATLFVLTWIGYGALWLVRLAPRVKALPAWVESWLSPIDYVMITVIALSGLSLAISQF